MIRYVSSFSVGTLHGMVNGAMLKMLCRAFPDSEIQVAAASSGMPVLQKAVEEGKEKLSFKSLAVTTGKGRLSLLKRYIQSAYFNIRELWRSEEGDIIFYNFNNVFSLALVNLISRKWRKNREVFILCHGEMEYLANADKHPQFYKKILIRLTKGFFQKKKAKNISPELKFIVMGDVILYNLSFYIERNLLARFYSIDHPVVKEKRGSSSSSTEVKSGKIKVGTVGIQNKYKGSDTFLEIAENLKDLPHLEFHAVGQIQSDIEKFRNLGIVISDKAEEAIPAEEFSSRVRDLDLILLLYPSDSYHLIASGAFLDTIRYGKPLLAISTEYFEYFFDKFGSVGTLVKDKEAIAECLRNLTRSSLPVIDTEKILDRLSPESLAPQLKAIIGARIQRN